MPGPYSSLLTLTPPASETIAGRNGLPGADFFRSFAENSPNPVFVCDAASRLVWFNAECERLSGYSAQELASLRLEHLASPEGRWYAPAAIRRRLTNPDRMR